MRRGYLLVITFAVVLAGLTLLLLARGQPMPAAHAAPLLQAPVNDDFANALTISAMPYSDTQDTTLATTQANDPRFPCIANNSTTNWRRGWHSVWYAYTATAAGTLHVDTIGSDYDTVLGIWTGTWGSLGNVGCDDDSGPGTRSSLDVAVTAGTTYYIEVAGYNSSSSGNLVLSAELVTPPANDDFDNAFVISSTPYTYTQNTALATTQANDPRFPCIANNSTTNWRRGWHSVWYAYAASAAGTLHVDTIGSDYDTVLGIWTGTWGSLTNVGCDDDSGPGTRSSLDVAVTAGTTYYIEVAGYYSSSSGNLVLSAELVTPPANDDFDNAFIISTTPYTYTQNTSQATTAPDDPSFYNCGTGNGSVHSHSVWYRFVAPSDGTLYLDTIGSGYDTVLAVWTGPRGSLSMAACDDDSGPGVQSYLEATVTAGTTYHIEVVSYRSTPGGSLEIHATFPMLKMEMGTLSGVDENWTTVTLSNTYSSMVVICTPNYANNSIPIVTRVRNASGSSFEVRIQNPHASNPDVNLAAETVHYLVMEEGDYTLPDGRRIEAQKYNSTVTDRSGSWNGQIQSYLQTYSNPVILGQVTSYNDSDWSAFWDRGQSRQQPPNSTNLRTGKMVGQDSDTTRFNETVGFIVIEQGNGTIDGVAYEARLGADNVRGVGNSPPYNYTFVQPFGSTPQVAVISQAAMDGNDGSWAVLYGASPLSSNQISLAVDEDQIGDSERAHTTEQVAYLVFGEPLVIRPYDLVLSKSDSPDPVWAGDTLTYTLTYTNAGFATAQDVAITDTLPVSVTFGGVVNATPPITLTSTSPPAWYTPTLAAGASGTIVFTVTVDAYAGGTIANSAIITSGIGISDENPGDNEASESTTVTPWPTVDFSSPTYSVDEGAGTVSIIVILDAASPMTATVDYATSDGTAEAGQDYTAVADTLAFAPGVTNQIFTVPITDDLMTEPAEIFTVTLSNPSNARTGTNNPATVTIIDNDPLVQFSSASYSVGESAGPAVITVTLAPAPVLTVTVDYATSDGTAMAGSDYTAVSDVLTFTPGVITQTFTVPITDDVPSEPDETINLTLSNATNAIITGTNPAVLTIVDDDFLPTVRFSSASYSVEEDAGPAIITVTLDAASALTVTVDYATSDGTAIAGSDYTTATGTLIFSPSSTSQTFTVPITDDAFDETDEALLLTLSNPASATITGTNPVSLTIVDDDPVPPTAYYQMEEAYWDGTPGEVQDASGNSFHGAAFDNATTDFASPAIPGDPGTCRYGVFDGNQDTIAVPHDSALEPVDAVTLMAWVRRDQHITAQIIRKGKATWRDGYMLRMVRWNGWSFVVQTGAGKKSAELVGSVPDTDWHHVAGVFDGTSVTLYVDGEMAAQDSFAPTQIYWHPTAKTPLFVSPQSKSFSGDIDEARVYAQALSASEVASVMSETHPCALPAPIYQIEARVGNMIILVRVQIEDGKPRILSWEILP